MMNIPGKTKHLHKSATIVFQVLLLSIACGLNAAESSHAEPRQAPNILFIAIDDLRCELGCYGSELAKSPNIDALAASGIQFNRAYCQQAICGPSRASVMTGLRPDATQVHGNHTHFRDVHPDIVTLPQLFKNHGYHTRSMGKIYHGVFPEGSSRTIADTFGDTHSWSIPTFRPGPRYYYTEAGIEAAKSVYEKIYKPKSPDGNDWTKKLVFGPATEAPDVADNVLYDGQVADHAVDSLKKLAKTDEPFFLAVGFIKPHSPYIAPKKYWELYDAETIPLADPTTLKTDGIPSISLHGSGELRRYTDQQKKGPISEADQRNVRHAYLACISFIDAQVGRVLAELRTQGLAENTIVVLWSDHGYHLGERGLWGKTTNFELDTRVPLIIRAPGNPSGDCDAIVELVDIYPTLAELVGMPPRAYEHHQGESLVPLLDEPNRAWKNRAFSQFTKGTMRGYSMRTDTHRYTEWMNLKTGEISERTLFDHRTDPVESKNLIPSAMPELIGEMSRILNRGEGWRQANQPHLTLDPVFTDNMVFQRHKLIPVWGTAAPSSVIEITFGGQQKATTTDSSGRWSVELSQLDPTERPQKLFVRHGDDIILKENILIGDVWICSGQSNMRWSLKQTADAKSSIANSANSNLRILNLASTIHPGSGKFPLSKLRNTFADNLYATDGWQVARPETVPDFSGVAYHFGKMLQAETGVPIGLINNSVGGSPMEAWIPNATPDPNWLENSDLPKWVEGRAKLNLTKWTERSAPPTPHHPFEPGFLFDAGIRPFSKMPVRGVIWYQGESNATEDGAGSPSIDPRKNFATHKQLIESWRAEFQDNDLPFYLVQLPGLNRDWAAFREVQSKINTLIPNTHLAVSFDVGHPTNVHPTQKKPIGERLAKLALKHEYGMPIIAEAPRLTGWKFSEDSVLLTFDRPVKVESGATLEISGKDQQFKKQAITQNESTGLVCRTDPVGSKIEAIRYAWENDPKAAITCAESGLPVAPFRTDNWPLVAPAKPPVASDEKINGVWTGFENVEAGEILGDKNSDGIVLSADPGHAKISNTHSWKGKHGLHLLGGENRQLTIRFPETVKAGKVIAFQAERWTSRQPFQFSILGRKANTDEKWRQVYDGTDKVVVGREFMSSVLIPVTVDLNELKLISTTPEKSGVLIDHIRILDQMPPGQIAKEPEHRVKLRALGEDGVNSTRIPGIATTNEGTLIAVYDNRNRSRRDLPGDIDVGMSRSTDGGDTWAPMKVIMDMGDDPKWSYDGIGDPAVLVDRKSGTIWVAATWSHGERSWHGSGPGMEPEETGQFILVRSDDDGKSWSKPINITKQIKDPSWRFVLVGPGKGISMKDGTLVFPAQFRGENEPPVNGKPFSTLIYSKDRGETWKIGTGVKIDTTEAQLVELKDGSIMINCRDNRGGSRSIYTTNDLGKTWKAHPTSRGALPEPVCMASLIRVETKNHGPLLFFSNPAQSKGRSKMTIKVSNDEGLTWPEKWHTLVDAGPSAYSCMTAIGDDKIGLVYETPGELIFVRYSIEDLLN